MEQKFIIGDIVEYDNKIMVVKEPRDGRHFDLSCPKEGLVYDLVDIEEIKPVHLTPVILKKNGWEPCCEWYISPDEMGVAIGLLSQTGCVWNAYLGNEIIRSGINSVSDLQHLLFGLGLNDEMEV